MGSKTESAQASHIVVEVKSELEKIRNNCRMWNSLHRSKLLSLKEERELEDDGQEGEKVGR